jgi:prepilin-type N-terminal cleavage/methylation domain-containing protein
MAGPRAFTLTELLVVISIITLLIAILVPSLNAVKDLSRVTRCSTNLSALARDVQVYMNASDGLLPLYRYTEGHFSDPPPTPWHTTIAYSTEGDPVNDPETGLLNDARNLGFLYKHGYINNYEVLYCPRQRQIEHTLEPYPKPWSMGPDEILVGYMYNPNVEVVGGQVQYMFRLQADTFPADRTLICDLPWSAEVTSHTVGNEWRWNVSRLNGNVETVSSKYAQEHMAEHPTMRDNWDEFRNNVYNWVLMQ